MRRSVLNVSNADLFHSSKAREEKEESLSSGLSIKKSQQIQNPLEGITDLEVKGYDQADRSREVSSKNGYAKQVNDGAEDDASFPTQNEIRMSQSQIEMNPLHIDSRNEPSMDNHSMEQSNFNQEDQINTSIEAVVKKQHSNHAVKKS